VQHEQLGPRGHKDDPLYKIRDLLRHGAEHLTPRQVTRLESGLTAGDPNSEVTLAWQCYQTLRAAYAAKNPADGKKIAEQVLGSFATCPIPEVARLGRTLRQWRSQVLAYFTTRASPTAAARRSTCSSKRPAAWPTASATSTTTAYASCSSPTAPAPTASREPCSIPKSQIEAICRRGRQAGL
jgi:Transposase